MPLSESKLIWMDGELVPWTEAKVHVLTHSLHYGCGVFEGIRAYETSRGPAVFRLEEHIDRLYASAAIFLIEIPFTRLGSLMRVDARVNDLVTVPFLIDTGASGVSIPHSYAAKLGVRVRPDTPQIRVTTANGVVARPLIALQSIEIAGARVENLTATLDPGLDFGLLGGSFFNNYVYRVDAARSMITLAPCWRALSAAAIAALPAPMTITSQSRVTLTPP